MPTRVPAPIIRRALLLAGAVALAACASTGVQETALPEARPAAATSADPAGVTLGLLDPAAVAALLEAGDYLVVNVHIPFEGEIRGTDLHIPFNDEEALLAGLPEDRDAPILLYCRSGGMSRTAGDRLIELGYRDVVHLEGGMRAWEESGRPIEGI